MASPQATALVGARVDVLRTSPLGQAVLGELFDGAPAIPALPCLRNANEILVSSPDYLAIAVGSFPAQVVQEEALAAGLRRSWYKGLDLWITPGAETLSLARWNDQLVLIGLSRTLRATIDRAQSEDTREYSPLLAKAARYSQQDFWVVAGALPDPLAGRFLPIDLQAESFEGGASLQQGLQVQAAVIAATREDASDLKQQLRGMLPDMPSLFRSMDVESIDNTVSLYLGVSAEAVQASLNQPRPKPVPTPAAVAVNGTSQPVLPAASPVSPAPPARRVIRIYGLDEGVREIEMQPAAKP